MSKKYVIDIGDVASLEKALKGIEQYKKWRQRKSLELARRLADLGAESAQLGFDYAFYVGEKNVKVSVRKKRGENAYIVTANGEAVLFIEFGAGIAHAGTAHPEASEHGMGPGTYPGKGHWNNPHGWYLPKDVQQATGYKKTRGNPAYMPMYNARKLIEQNITQIVREVFEVE